MHLEFFDQSAIQGRSPVHRASALSKLLLVGAAVAGMLLARSPWYYGTVAAVLLGLAALARVPLLPLLELLVYPVAFAGVFALSGLAGGAAGGWLVVARSGTTALAVLLVFATTHYAEVFGALRTVMPGLLGDVLLLTYRSFFVLLRELQRTLVAIRLKGGGRPAALFQNVRTAGAVVGLTTLHALEMAERQHQVLTLRGYRGVIPTSREWWRPTACDLVPLAGALALALAAGFFR